ncbi:MAG: hypothetical protein RR458_02900 [Clostridia bacterium]
MSNLIQKYAQVEKLAASENELRLINKLSIDELSQENVFTFKMAICDNEVDRVCEVFPLESLKKMAVLFEGRTILKDHNRQTDNQVARIYETEVDVDNSRTTKNNEPYSRIIAKCYMVRTERNKDLITEISAGIRKEVSVSCSMSSAICSICGTDNTKKYCKHFGGRDYDGQVCYFKLIEPVDAYEVSFVGVPAQPAAGVVSKNYNGNETTQKEFEQQEEKTIAEKNAKIETEKELTNQKIDIVDSFLFIQNQKNK